MRRGSPARHPRPSVGRRAFVAVAAKKIWAHVMEKSRACPDRAATNWRAASKTANQAKTWCSGSTVCQPFRMSSKNKISAIAPRSGRKPNLIRWRSFLAAANSGRTLRPAFSSSERVCLWERLAESPWQTDTSPVRPVQIKPNQTKSNQIKVKKKECPRSSIQGR